MSSYKECKDKAKEIAVDIEKYLTTNHQPHKSRSIDEYFAPEFPEIEEYGFENNVLALGLNPSEGGNKRPENGDKYNIFNHIPNRKRNDEVSFEVIKEVQDLTYSKYFRPYVDYFANLEVPYFPLWYNESHLNTILSDSKHSNVLTNEVKSHMKIYSKDDNKNYIIFADLIQYAKTDSKPIIDALNSKEIKKSVEEYIIMLLGYLKPKLVLSANAAVSHFLCEHLASPNSCTFIKHADTTIFLGSMLTGQRAMDVFSRNRLFKEMTDYLETIG